MKHFIRTVAACLIAVGFANGALAQTELKLASNAIKANPPKVGDQVAWEWLAKEMEAATDSEVTLNVFWSGSLGAEADLKQSLQSGVLDILPNSGSNASDVIPEFGILSTSYLFRDFEHYREVVNDSAFFGRMQAIVKDHDLGFQLVGMGATGSRNLYNRKHAVERPTDAEGLNMRVMSSPVEFKVWSELGTLPTNIASTEIYTSLQTGVIDAAESSIPFIVSNKYYEVAPFITLTNHQISTHLFFMNDASIENLPEVHRQTVLDLIREAGNVQIDATARLSEELLDTLRSQPGVTVSDVDTAPFAEKLSALQEEVAAELGVSDLLEIVKSH